MYEFNEQIDLVKQKIILKSRRIRELVDQRDKLDYLIKKMNSQVYDLENEMCNLQFNKEKVKGGRLSVSQGNKKDI